MGAPRATNVVRAEGLGGNRKPEQKRSRLRTLLPSLALIALPISAVVLCGWRLGAERRAVLAMPPAQRAVVYGDLMDAFATACSPPHAGLLGRCRAQASFLIDFAECDAHCRSIAAPLLRWRS